MPLRDDPGKAISALAEAVSVRDRLAFACLCCRRILDLIPTAAGRSALHLSEQFCNGAGESPRRLAEVALSAKNDEERLREEMNRVSEAAQVSQEHDAACSRFYGAMSARKTADYCLDPTLDAADEISENAALAKAFHASANREDNESSTLVELQELFDDDYCRERAAHCDLLRRMSLLEQAEP
jgi:hypothetical protein